MARSPSRSEARKCSTSAVVISSSFLSPSTGVTRESRESGDQHVQGLSETWTYRQRTAITTKAKELRCSVWNRDLYLGAFVRRQQRVSPRLRRSKTGQAARCGSSSTGPRRSLDHPQGAPAASLPSPAP